ncbi:MFS transporter [Cellulomonas fengjieae]|uniref:MFS transporter n=1 Tax=Cellulomonas fengjieae TaxID=2819978 RepID=A0ABS3SLF6_9CELL|nr:MFS transporter [Cellulomonas fengjieae]MBO3086560.1 MFS transporter [Cellulomonas fengjieae]MBO3100556.1 MFS transporter [Cellulomonas fengjieae]QVI66585.1 MFS transporter [Cellulomonas fengjieae]
MTAARSAARGVLLAAVLLYALNLRAPITALAPVVDDVRTGLGLTAAGVGLLTGIPVLCFALATPLMAVLLGRLGTGRVVAASLVTILVGTVLRVSDGFGTALVGTVLIGVAITAGNVAVPVVISRDFPGHVPRVTGLYTAALNGGSVLTTTLTAPLADLVGWRWALASWGLLAVVALVAWQRAFPVGRPEPVVVVAASAAPAVWRRPVTWFLAVAFAGQSFSYFAISAWLPSVLQDTLGLERAASGGAAAFFQLFGMLGGIAVPVALGRRAPVAAVSAVIVLGWLTLPVGLLLAPSWWALWCTFAGVAQGGNFAVIFTVIASTAGSPAAARRMSATVQTVGYSCAALGPSVLGAVHTSSGGWTAPLLVELGALVTMGVASALGLRSMRREA